MLETIISKIILDRACPVCGSIKSYTTTDGFNRERVECKACKGRGYLSDSSSASAFLTPHTTKIPAGLQMSMRQQNILLVDTTGDFYQQREILRGYWFKRLYTYNVCTDDRIFLFAQDRLKEIPSEIHMYFDK